MKYQRSARMEARLAGNRQRIMAATRALIARGGFREVTISAVAEQAGLSSGAIYRYFSSKSELYVQALVNAMDREIELLNEIVEDKDKNAAERLRATVRAFVGRALEGPHLAYAFIAEPIDPEVDAGRIVCRERLREVFAKILQDGLRSGELPEQNAEITAACLVGAFTEALTRPMAMGTEIGDEEQLVEAIVAFCSRAVAGTRGAVSSR